LNFAVTLLRIPGRTDEAVKHLKQVLRLQPNNVPARQILSRINGFSQ
jgi:cytochrome c-type biogenesis protein CcmH/NrfG